MTNNNDTITLTRKNHVLTLMISGMSGMILGVMFTFFIMHEYNSYETTQKAQSGFEKIDKEKGVTGMTYEQKMNKQTEDSFAAIKKNVQSAGQ